MMIRINLLPVRQVQKREQGRQFIVVVVGLFIMGVIANGYWYFWVDGQRGDAQRRLDETQSRIKQLDTKIGEVANIQKREKEVRAKLEELQKLNRQRAGPVKLLDALATATPKKVGLISFTEKNGAATLSGLAESFDDVSEFMRTLNSVVWTPRGMGRVVERKRDGAAARVELFSDASIVDVPISELGYFFSNLELKSTETAASPVKGGPRPVKFDMSLAVNLAI